MTQSDFITLLLSGLWTTALLTVFGSLIGTVMALLSGLACASRHALLRWPVMLVIEFFRGTSCYVQLFAAFFILPMYGLDLSAFTAAALVLGLNVGSYGAEVVRGAIRSVPVGQTEAAIALNFTRWQRFRHVTVPNALVLVLPAASNLFIDLLKLTPLASLITVSDLTYQAMVVRQQTGDTLVPFVIVFVVYFLFSSLIATVFAWLERRAKRGSEGLGGHRDPELNGGGTF